MAPQPLPAPPPNASGTVAGIVSTVAQTVGDGVKTFLKAIGLGALASDPSGSSNGWLYYNTTYHLLRIKAGGIWRAISTTYLYPEEYGAIIDSTASATVNTAALQSAFDASVSQGRTVYLSKGNYYVDGGVSATGEVHTIGGGLGLSLITADATFVGDAVIEVNGPVRFESFGVNAARETKYPFYFEGSAQAVFQSVGAYNGTRDGFHMPQSGVNDRLTFIECQASGNGTLYHTPGLDYSALSGSMRVSKIWGINTTSGSKIITGNGGAGEFLTMGLRQGDLIRVGSSSPDLFEIASVDSENQITAFNAATATRTSAEWGAGVGWGYYEARHNDNNINLLIGGLYRSNAGGGVAFQGLYGSRAYNVQIDNQPMCGLKVGNGEGPTYNTIVEGCYFEGIEGGLGPAVIFSTASGVSARQNMVEGTTVPFKVITDYAANGFWESRNAVEQIGTNAAYENRIPVTKTGVGGFTLNSALLENSQLLSVTGTIPMLPTVVHGQCYFGGSSVTNTATPTIAAGTEGQVFTLQNFSGAYTVTLQDNNTLSGSNLQLKTPTVTLDGTTQDSITFMYLGGTWYERSRSIAADIGGGGSGDVVAAGDNTFSGENTFNSVTTFTGAVVYTPNVHSGTFTAGDEFQITMDCTSGNSTCNLPAAASVVGRTYLISKIGSNTATIDPNGSETIDGAATYTVTTPVTIYAYGGNWWIL